MKSEWHVNLADFRIVSVMAKTAAEACRIAASEQGIPAILAVKIFPR